MICALRRPSTPGDVPSPPVYGLLTPMFHPIHHLLASSSLEDWRLDGQTAHHRCGIALEFSYISRHTKWTFSIAAPDHPKAFFANIAAPFGDTFDAALDALKGALDCSTITTLMQGLEYLLIQAGHTGIWHFFFEDDLCYVESVHLSRKLMRLTPLQHHLVSPLKHLLIPNRWPTPSLTSYQGMGELILPASQHARLQRLSHPPKGFDPEA